MTADKPISDALLQLKDALDESVLISVAGGDGILTDVNPALCRRSGFTAKELIGQHCDFLKAPNFPPDLLTELWATLYQGKIWHGESENRCKDGSTYWSDTTIVPVLNPDGTLARLIGVRKDITGNKQTEQNLLLLQDNYLETIRDFEGIFNQTDRWMVILSPEGIVQRANDTLLEQTHLARKDIIDKHVWNVSWWQTPDWLPEKLRQSVESAAVGNIQRFAAEHPLADSSRMVCEYLVKPIFSPSGRLQLVILEGNDITEVRRSQDQLNDLKYALDQSALVSITDTHGTIIYANRKFSEVSQYSRNELVGKNHRIINSGTHPKAFFAQMWQTLKAGKTWQGEICNRRKDGELFWVDATIVPQLNDKGEPYQFIAIPKEITDRKRTERRLLETFASLQEAKEAAEAASVAKGQFLANMSHEIRTPLNGVLGMASLLAEGDLNEQQREFARVIVESGEHLLTLINDILDFSKIEANKLTLEDIDVDIIRLIERAADPFVYSILQKGLGFHLDYSADIPRRVRTDPARIQQILNNLLSNALKFTQSGQITIQLKFCPIEDTPGSSQTSLTDPVGRFLISITDTGIGIPADKQGRIFDAFSQADASTTRKYGGTGLGLAIIQKLARLMGGSITLESQPGQGSTFTLDILLDLVEPFTPQAAQPENVSKPVIPGKILMASPDPQLLTILDRHLAHLGVDSRFRWQSSESEPCEAPADWINDPRPLWLWLDELLTRTELKAIAQWLKQYCPKALANGHVQVIAISGIYNELDMGLAETGLPGSTSPLHKPIRYTHVEQVLQTLQETQSLADSMLSDTSEDLYPSIEELLKTAFDTLADATFDTQADTPIRIVRLLLAEDNLINQKVFFSMLKRAESDLSEHGGPVQVDIQLAENGREALAALISAQENDRPFDLVMMDCQMPEMDGYEATQQIRAREHLLQSHTRIPVIAITANAMEGDRKRCLEAGMDDYLSKPMKPDQLSAILIKWLNLSKSEHTSL